jgi:cytoskeletal protein RodZ
MWITLTAIISFVAGVAYKAGKLDGALAWVKNQVVALYMKATAKKAAPLPLLDAGVLSREDWQAGDLWVKFRGFAKGAAWAMLAVALLIAAIWYGVNYSKPINIDEKVAPAVQAAPPAAANTPTKQPPKKATKPAKSSEDADPTKTEATPTTETAKPEPARQIIVERNNAPLPPSPPSPP